MKNEEKPNLFPEHFKIGKFSGSPRDFRKGLISMPRGGEDYLEYWYTDDPEESEYLDEDFQRTIDLKIEQLKKQGWDPNKQIFLATTQSHLDLGWMWRFRQGVGKAERTFKKVHGHFKLFKPFTFSGSQPACYQWVKFNSPEIWEMILEDVKNGRHELQGGSWSEADGRMPSGEAWVRQRLYGQLFYAKNFGKIANVAWFPDSFGYADNLPQFFAKSGADGFMTSKLTSNKETKWPFWAWIWESPDGSQVLSYLSGNHNKLGPLGGFDVRQRNSEVRESYVKSYKMLKEGTKLIANHEMDEPETHENISNEELPFIGCFFGEGDGGHGPQGVEMAYYRGFAERGYVKWASTREIFEELSKYRDRLPVWNEELYYQYHRGSLTTQTMMKRMNRFFEWNLPVLEGIYSIVTSISSSALDSFKTFYTEPDVQIPTTSNPIEQIWQNVLLMQFHDVLPGTSVSEVYDECYEMWYQDQRLYNRLKDEAMQGLIKTLELNPKNQEILLIEDLEKEIILKPMLFGNFTGAEGNKIFELKKDEIKNFVPIFALTKQFNGEFGLSPVQLLYPDSYCSDLDMKNDRYIFKINVNSWSCLLGWLIGISKDVESHEIEMISMELQNKLAKNNSEKNFGIIEENDYFVLKNSDFILKINKTSGMVTSIKLKESELLNQPSGLKLYNDKSTREPCWNLYPNWWNEPQNNSTSDIKVEITETGPIQYTIRVTSKLGKNSLSIVDYSVIKNIPGYLVEIGIDFHETETLVKYEFPLSIDGKYSVAETPYSTARRLNHPTANHDIPRWEKWMHTFVTIESDDESNKIGLAVINEGKYGFDTLNDSLGISIIHGPIYPGLNVVAWAKDERKSREEAGLGAPPTVTDQGESITRLHILPYIGTWKDGKIHSESHLFNTQLYGKIISNSEIANDLPKNVVKYNKDSILEGILNKLVPKCSDWQFIKSTQKSIEVTILKHGEELPDCLVSKNNEFENNKGLILRVVNNINQDNQTKLIINKILLDNATHFVEVDLLERVLNDGLIEKLDTNIKDSFNIDLRFRPHEIRTFKIVKNS
jgi:alpha-mannosidase